MLSGTGTFQNWAFVSNGAVFLVLLPVLSAVRIVERWPMSGKLGRMWKETAVASTRVLSQNLSGEI
jgi:hypothetical protein